MICDGLFKYLRSYAALSLTFTLLVIYLRHVCLLVIRAYRSTKISDELSAPLKSRVKNTTHCHTVDAALCHSQRDKRNSEYCCFLFSYTGRKSKSHWSWECLFVGVITNFKWLYSWSLKSLLLFMQSVSNSGLSVYNWISSFRRWAKDRE